MEEQLFNKYDIVWVLAGLKTNYEAKFFGNLSLKFEKKAIFSMKMAKKKN